MTGFGWQSRVVNNYFDGQDLVIQLRDPECCAQTISGNLFLTEARVILRPTTNYTNVTGLSITGNQFAGLGRCGTNNSHDPQPPQPVQGGFNEGCTNVWVDTDIASIQTMSGSIVDGNSCSGGRYCVSTKATKSVRQEHSTEFTVEFGSGTGSLLRGVPITQATYALMVHLVNNAVSLI